MLLKGLFITAWASVFCILISILNFLVSTSDRIFMVLIILILLLVLTLCATYSAMILWEFRND